MTQENKHHIVLSQEFFDRTTEMLGSKADKVERAFIHEVGHLYDRDIGNFSDNSELFFPGGKLHAEIKDYAGTSANTKDWFGYALNAVRTPLRELFAQVFTLFYLKPESMRETLPETHRFFQDQLGRREGRPAAAGRANLSSAPNQSVADKKTALLGAARTNDSALLRELSESDDAKSLQRAVAELPPGATADGANTRMAELVQDSNVAYDLTKKYSMDGSRINDESGNEVFGATLESNRLFTLILPSNGS